MSGFDMWETLESVYKDNFPDSTFHCGRLEEHSPKSLARKMGKVDLILASPECTNHSVAKGNKPRCEKSRETAMLVLEYAKAFQSRWLVMENVVSMKNWHRYNDLVDKIANLGYYTHAQTLNSADFGVPQARRRMFIICDRKKEPLPIAIPSRKKRVAGDIIDTNGTYSFTPLRTINRAKATLERAERAISEVGTRKPFLIVYYGTDHAGGWQSLDVPLRTITTLDRFAYVKPSRSGHLMRMLQPEELKQAMGWPKPYKINHGSRRDKIKMIGNAVCPPVMKSIVQSFF